MLFRSIQDPTLLHQVDVFGGLAPDGYILINTSRTFDALGVGEFVRGFHAEHLCTVPATELAMKHIGRPVPNAALLGGFAAVSGRLSIRSVLEAIPVRVIMNGEAALLGAARYAGQLIGQGDAGGRG